MDKFNVVVAIMAILFFSFSSYLSGIKEQQKTIETEIYKRCLDSDIYNEFQCYNMIIKGE